MNTGLGEGVQEPVFRGGTGGGSAGAVASEQTEGRGWVRGESSGGAGGVGDW